MLIELKFWFIQVRVRFPFLFILVSEYPTQSLSLNEVDGGDPINHSGPKKLLWAVADRCASSRARSDCDSECPSGNEPSGKYLQPLPLSSRSQTTPLKGQRPIQHRKTCKPACTNSKHGKPREGRKCTDLFLICYAATPLTHYIRNAYKWCAVIGWSVAYLRSGTPTMDLKSYAYT